MIFIEKVILSNFKKFDTLELDLEQDRNIIIGDNEAGKSSILQAIDLVLSGSRSKVESYGLENLFSKTATQSFLKAGAKISELPSLFIELYLAGDLHYELEGKNNSSTRKAFGLTMICEPIRELSHQIAEILKEDTPNFPYEYYSIQFMTFSGQAYTGYRKFLTHLVLDSSQINSEYAIREYVKKVYQSNTELAEKNRHKNDYRKLQSEFKTTSLNNINERLETYQFAIGASSKSDFESHLTITEDDVSIEHKGKGRQCFIKTEFALQSKNPEKKIDILLLEEPENHLSHLYMKRLVNQLSSTENQQLIIATHNSLISSRLGLKKVKMLNSSNQSVLYLEKLTDETAAFFMKAPDNNLLEFILSKKVLLVEGDAEYILMEALFYRIVGTTLENLDIHLISVGGTSFGRYMELAGVLGIQTAVLRDNDRKDLKEIIDLYAGRLNKNVRVFTDDNSAHYTFEVSIYQSNSGICDELFSPGRKTLSVQDYMLNNKTEVAFQLLTQKAEELVVPNYINEAFIWLIK